MSKSQSLMKLSCCTAIVFLAVQGFAAGSTTITFAELSERPLDNVSLNGVTFHFSGVGRDIPVALFGTTLLDYSETMLMNAPWAAGDVLGQLTLSFEMPVNSLSFEVGLTTTTALESGFQVVLYNGNETIDSLVQPTFPGGPGPTAFSEGQFTYSNATELITSAVVTFDTSSAQNFVLDNLTYNSVPEPAPPIIMCSDPLFLECMGGSAIGILDAGVMDTNGLPLEVIWTVNGTAYQTNDIPSGGAVTVSNVTFTADFESGEHTVTVSASNGRTIPATCSTMVTVGDTLPPDVSGIYATPDLLWPPNRSMVPVSVVVNVADDCDASPAAHITQVISNEPLNPFVPDWEITGPLSVNLRAERLGSEGGRIYTIVVECEDSSGNISHASVDVVVPHDYR